MNKKTITLILVIVLLLGSLLGAFIFSFAILLNASGRGNGLGLFMLVLMLIGFIASIFFIVAAFRLDAKKITSTELPTTKSTRMRDTFIVLTLIALVISGFVYVRTREINTKNSQVDNTIQQITQTHEQEVSSRPIYSSAEFGFSFTYPSAFQIKETTGNTTNQSGTNPQPLKTIEFSTGTREQFRVDIMPIWKDAISADTYRNGYLSLGSRCDTRYIDGIVNALPQETNGISILNAGVVTNRKSTDCYYFKTGKGNLIVFSETDAGNDIDNDILVSSRLRWEIVPTIKLLK